MPRGGEGRRRGCGEDLGGWRSSLPPAAPCCHVLSSAKHNSRHKIPFLPVPKVVVRRSLAFFFFFLSLQCWPSKSAGFFSYCSALDGCVRETLLRELCRENSLPLFSANSWQNQQLEVDEIPDLCCFQVLKFSILFDCTEIVLSVYEILNNSHKLNQGINRTGTLENNTGLNYSFSCNTPTMYQEEGWNCSTSGGRREHPGR